MPRVSDAHRQARRDQILDAAERRFARDGFHATGMAEIVAEAGMSAGGVYRYFTGKEALIGAIAERLLRNLGGVLEAATAGAGSVEALVEGTLDAASRVLDASTVKNARLLPQIWSEALRDEAIGAHVRISYANVLEALTKRATHIEAAAGLPAGATPRSVAHVVLATVQGFVLQRVLLGADLDVDAFRSATHALLRAS